jgi:hypothetical protein
VVQAQDIYAYPGVAVEFEEEPEKRSYGREEFYPDRSALYPLVLRSVRRYSKMNTPGVVTPGVAVSYRSNQQALPPTVAGTIARGQF